MAVNAGLTLGRQDVGIVTLVDPAILDARRPKAVEILFQLQIEAAHAIVLTKTDGMTPDGLNAAKLRLAEVAPGRSIHVSAAIDPAKVMFGAARLRARLGPTGPFHDPAAMVAHSFPVNVAIGTDEAQRWLDRLPDGLLRLKGHVPHPDGGAVELQFTGATRNARRVPDWRGDYLLVAIGVAHNAAASRADLARQIDEIRGGSL